MQIAINLDGWGTPKVLMRSVDELENPYVAINSSGDAVAVWGKEDSSSIYASRYE